MSRMFAYLLRFATIILGFVAAALAASAFIHLFYLGALDWKPEETPLVVLASFIFSIPFVALFVAYFAFTPSLVVILVAELLGRRDWLSYALGGGVVGAAIVGMVWRGALPLTDGANEIVTDSTAQPGTDTGGPVASDPRFILLMIGAGIFAGVVYWLIAGRWAGGFYSSRREASPPEN